MPDSTPQRSIVLDACVLFPASLRDMLLRAAEADLYRACFSRAILDEVERNLVDTGKMTRAQAARLGTNITGAFPDGLVSGYDALLPVLTCDPKDRHVLAAAILLAPRA